VLTVAGAGFQYKANADEGMTTAENAVRTASSTGGSALGGTLLGGACAFSGVGTVATGGCAVVGGVVGGWAGDKAGQGVYWVGSHADDAWDATGGQIVHLLGG
jgi:hypothetical protein